MMVSYAMPSEVSKVKHIQLRFPALPYIYCDFSGFHEFHNILWYLEKDLILCNFALQNVIFDLFDTFMEFGTSDEP